MQVVCPIREKTATPSGVKSRTRVPTELLGKTSSRLNWLAILVLVSSVVFFLSRHYLESEFRAVEKLPIFRLDLAVLALASLAVIVIHRRGFLPAARVLEVGLIFEITVSLCLATLEFANRTRRSTGQSVFPYSPCGFSCLGFLFPTPLSVRCWRPCYRPAWLPWAMCSLAGSPRFRRGTPTTSSCGLCRAF